MARLTRAQKYADLREKLVNETEEKSASSVINEYEQRLKDLENIFNTTVENREQVQEEPKVEPVFTYTKPEEKVEEIKPVEEIIETPIVEPVKEEKQPEPTYQNLSENDIRNIIASLDLPEEIHKEETKTEEPQQINTIEDFFKYNLEPETKPQEEPEVIEIEEVKEVTFELPVEEDHTNAVIENENDALNDRTKEIAEIVDEEEETVPQIIEEEPVVIDIPVNDISSDYLKEALIDVNNFNIEKGNQTLNDIVDSIRHNPAEFEKQNVEIDEQFQNTVNVEIEKIKQALSETDQIDLTNVVEKPVEENEAEYFKKFIEETAKEEIKTEEHPVLTKALEEEAVEIKPYEETININNSNVINDTIPFVIEKEEPVEEEDEEEGEPNTLLNIILIILILILIAVLGIIGYYILKIKGII